MTFSTGATVMPMSHTCSRAHQVFGAFVCTARSARSGRLVPVWLSGIVAPEAAIGTQRVAPDP